MELRWSRGTLGSQPRGWRYSDGMSIERVPEGVPATPAEWARMPKAFRRWTVALMAEWKADAALLAARVEGQRHEVDPTASGDPRLRPGQGDSARLEPAQENQAS